MPRMNGYQAAAAIRALPRPDAISVVIIAMTADVLEMMWTVTGTGHGCTYCQTVRYPSVSVFTARFIAE